MTAQIIRLPIRPKPRPVDLTDVYAKWLEANARRAKYERDVMEAIAGPLLAQRKKDSTP